MARNAGLSRGYAFDMFYKAAVCLVMAIAGSSQDLGIQ